MHCKPARLAPLVSLMLVGVAILILLDAAAWLVIAIGQLTVSPQGSDDSWADFARLMGVVNLGAVAATAAIGIGALGRFSWAYRYGIRWQLGAASFLVCQLAFWAVIMDKFGGGADEEAPGEVRALFLGILALSGLAALGGIGLWAVRGAFIDAAIARRRGHVLAVGLESWHGFVESATRGEADVSILRDTFACWLARGFRNHVEQDVKVGSVMFDLGTRKVWSFLIVWPLSMWLGKHDRWESLYLFRNSAEEVPQVTPDDEAKKVCSWGVILAGASAVDAQVVAANLQASLHGVAVFSLADAAWLGWEQRGAKREFSQFLRSHFGIERETAPGEPTIAVPHAEVEGNPTLSALGARETTTAEPTVGVPQAEAESSSTLAPLAARLAQSLRQKGVQVSESSYLGCPEILTGGWTTRIRYLFVDSVTVELVKQAKHLRPSSQGTCFIGWKAEQQALDQAGASFTQPFGVHVLALHDGVRAGDFRREYPLGALDSFLEWEGFSLKTVRGRDRSITRRSPWEIAHKGGPQPEAAGPSRSSRPYGPP